MPISAELESFDLRPQPRAKLVAEAALSVEGAHRKQGLGARLFQRLRLAAAEHGIDVIDLIALPSNLAVRAIARNSRCFSSLRTAWWRETEDSIMSEPCARKDGFDAFADGNAIIDNPFIQFASMRRRAWRGLGRPGGLLGQLPFFVDFLKGSSSFDAFVADCPLRYVSPNAPGKRDVLGTAMLSMLAGHRRYAHIAALRCYAVLPELLGMGRSSARTRSDAPSRRSGRQTDGAAWLRNDLAFCVEPLLAEPWILDVDATIKPLYGHEARGGARLQSQEARASEPS